MPNLPLKESTTCNRGGSERYVPDGIEIKSTLVSQLKQCGNRRDLQGGKALHSNVIESGCHVNRYVAHTLISMYSKCGSMNEAQNVFESMLKHDVVSWSALIVGYVENGESLTAFNVFNSMDCAPNGFTFVAALKACAALAKLDKTTCLQKGVIIHKLAREHGFDKDVFVASTLINMYSKCGSLTHAQDVFDRMPHRSVVSWNVLILGYVENGESLAALHVFNSMDCAPDGVTFVAALKACAGLACLEKGLIIHKQSREYGFDTDVNVANTLIDMYGKCGNMSKARETFNGMVHRSVVSWTALIVGYVENGEGLMALEVFDSMECAPNRVTFVAALKACTAMANELDKKTCLEKGIIIHSHISKCELENDIVVANTLVDMYSKCGDILQARDVFDRMIHRDVVSWTALILGYVENGESTKALEVFNIMDCVPNPITLVAALKACTSLADREGCLQKGVDVHKQARERGFDTDVFVANTLIDMYSKCRDMLRARDVFNGLRYRDVVSWNVLILGYVENGESSMALNVFNGMECAPDSVTFVAALKACASLGALESGQSIHERIYELGFEQDKMVANCLVDFYGKCGNMAAAQGVFNRMSSRDIVSWNALMGGYTLLGDTSQVFSLLKRMEETHLQMDSVTMVLILTVCSHTGRVEDGQRYFEIMPTHGIIPTEEHYTCMIDMLGRANRLQEALSLIRKMHLEVSSHVWLTLLGGCWKWSNVEIGKVAFLALVAKNNEEHISAAYVLMRNIYKRLGMWKEGEQIEAERQGVSGHNNEHSYTRTHTHTLTR